MPAPRYLCSVLVVDDEPLILTLLTQQLGHHFEVVTAATVEEAKRLFAARPVDIVVADLSLPEANGIQLLDWVYRTAPRTARVLMSGAASLQQAADAINCGHIHRLILKPWRGEDLIAHLREVSRNVLLERSHERLLEELRTLNQELEQRVAERTQELSSVNQILEKMALTDQLTGLQNRRSIEIVSRQELLRRSRTPSPITFALLDVDRFKSINSQFLLSGGDHTLVCLAQAFQETIRGTDAIGRVGGEEFMLVAPDTDAAGAQVLAERIRAAVEALEVRHNGQRIPVTISGGYAVADGSGPVTFEALRELAAVALSDAKAGGRNRNVIKVCTPDPVPAGA